MSLTVIKPGIYTSLQILDGTGLQAFGVSPRGPMDQLAHRLANNILSNRITSAVMEIHFPGPVLQCEKKSNICITGADFDLRKNGMYIALNEVHTLIPGDILSFQRMKQGMRAYLAIKGGFTFEKSFYNKVLKKEDRLTANEENDPAHLTFKNIIIHDESKPFNDVFYFPGPEYDILDTESKEHLLKKEFIITASSNRMGLQLQGPLLKKIVDKEMLSAPVTMGTVQLLPSGNMIVLMADRNTTGGYPRVIQIANVSLPILAQLKPGAPFKLRQITFNEAYELFIAQQKKRYGTTVN